MLFRAQSGSHLPRRSRGYAKYADIRHFFIYSLNPSFFMLCLEESDNGDKKCYESFRGQNEEDVQRLCELTARAQQSGTNTLPLPNDPKYSTVKEGNTAESERATDGSPTEGLNTEEGETPYVSPLNNRKVKATRYDSVNGFSTEYDGTVSKNHLNANTYNQPYDFKNEPTTQPEYEVVQPARSNNVAAQRTSLNSPTNVYRSPALLIRDSRQASKERTPKIISKKAEPIYLTYRRNQFEARPTNSIYGREELTRIFGEDVTYVSLDQKTGVNMSPSGPIFLYALRTNDIVQSYHGNDLVSATNSPRFNMAF